MRHIRPLDPASAAEIDLVAQRMRATLIEVEGEAVGEALYTLDWLRERVRQHLVPDAAVWLLEVDGAIAGHTIVRRETDGAGHAFGLISTTYVLPAVRRQGHAAALLAAGEAWMQTQDLARSATWTSVTNTALIALYTAQGYREAERGTHPQTGTTMVRLARALA
ncbi:MAG: GNAT family N-acetyltransferase [Proteobacteria bacterium]|nr:GNAT family N-acetyltransferase [Pseudomonadota bacterium]